MLGTLVLLGLTQEYHICKGKLEQLEEQEGVEDRASSLLL